MRLPKLMRFLLWRAFLHDRHSNGKNVVYNYIKYDEEYDSDIFLVFVRGERGHLFMGGIDHTETSVAEIIQYLEQEIKVIYNSTGCDYEIKTVMGGEENEEFDRYVNKALQPLTLKDKLNRLVANVCFG